MSFPGCPEPLASPQDPSMGSQEGRPSLSHGGRVTLEGLRGHLGPHVPSTSLSPLPPQAPKSCNSALPGDQTLCGVQAPPLSLYSLPHGECGLTAPRPSRPRTRHGGGGCLRQLLGCLSPQEARRGLESLPLPLTFSNYYLELSSHINTGRRFRKEEEEVQVRSGGG